MNWLNYIVERVNIPKFYQSNMDAQPLLDMSEITCPHCNYSKTYKLTMDTWNIAVECENCHKIIRGIPNKHGWPWVFCSYGTNPWLAIQKQSSSWEWMIATIARNSIYKPLVMDGAILSFYFSPSPFFHFFF